MSWMLALFSHRRAPDRQAALSKIHPQPLHTFLSSEVYLAAGGIPETCRFQTSSAGAWLVLGTGIRLREGSCSILGNEEWDRFLAPPLPDIGSLEGHFAALRIRDGNGECFSDQMGLRTLYACRVPDGVALSTRLDWLARLCPGAEIDFEQFGAHWKLYNQFSYRPLLKGVERLGPGGRLSCSAETLSVSSRVWRPGDSTSSDADLVDVLQSLLHPDGTGNRQLSLGLSGGLDSRLLLALLASGNRGGVPIHTFGDPGEPDVRIAGTIAADLGLRVTRLHEDPPPAERLKDTSLAYVAGNTLEAPVSTILRLGHYPKLHAEGKLVVDGAFGESLRRQYFNRLIWRGQRGLAAGSPRAVLPFLAQHRASIFNRDAELVMAKGMERELASLFAALPPVREIGREDFSDLLSICYRLPNAAGFEQARMDEQIVSYMPFAQPAIMRRAMEMPLSEKINGKFHRSMIRSKCPRLSRYPLVKGTIVYPYALPTVPAWAWRGVKSALGLKYRDPTSVIYLSVMRDHVLDAVRSDSARTYAPYDYPRILDMAERFYAGDRSLASELDWWFSFDLWRTSMDQS